MKLALTIVYLSECSEITVWTNSRSKYLLNLDVQTFMELLMFYRIIIKINFLDRSLFSYLYKGNVKYFSCHRNSVKTEWIYLIFPKSYVVKIKRDIMIWPLSSIWWHRSCPSLDRCDLKTRWFIVIKDSTYEYLSERICDVKSGCSIFVRITPYPK